MSYYDITSSNIDMYIYIYNHIYHELCIYIMTYMGNTYILLVGKICVTLIYAWYLVSTWGSRKQPLLAGKTPHVSC
jgi:hypothetical protein